jgi:hypothetical protein
MPKDEVFETVMPEASTQFMTIFVGFKVPEDTLVRPLIK